MPRRRCRLVVHGEACFQVTFEVIYQTDMLCSDTKLKSCRDALFSTDPSTDRDMLIQTKGERTSGTCEWIVRHCTFQSWLRGDLNLLWIRGGPGKGKTMMSIFLTQHLSAVFRRGLIYYFCSSERNDATTALRGLIWQLTETHQELTSHVLPHMDPIDRRRATLTSSETLWNLFRKLVQMVESGRVYVLIDGLDECNDKSGQWLASKLASFGRDPQDSNMSVMVLSRQIRAFMNSNTIRLDPDHDNFVSTDVEAYIRVRVEDLSHQLEFTDDYREHMVHILVKKSEGTFLWVGFVMEELFTLDTISEVTMALEDIPAGLPAFYARMLQSIKAIHREVSIRLLTWVAVSFRRPTIETLVDVLRCPTPKGIHQRQATLDCVRYCAPLLVIRDQGVEFVHQSAKDCLLLESSDAGHSLGAFRIETHSANLYAAQRCLQALSNGTYLQYYALLNWPKHARSLGEHLLTLIEREPAFFETHSAVRDSWWRKYSYNFQGVPNKPPPRLHVACFLGLETLVRFILHELEISCTNMTERRAEKGCSGWSPFDYAAENGHQALEQILLNSGPPDDWWDAVHTSFDRRGHLDEYFGRVEFLLGRGADPNTRDQSGRWPLQYAIMKRQNPVVQLLTARGARDDITVWQKDNPRLLRDAIITGSIPLVEFILTHGGDTNAPDVDGMTPIVHSMSRKPFNLDLVKLILEHGASLDVPKSNDLLLQALLEEDRQFVTWLLAHGAEPNIYDEEEQHVLNGVFRRGHEGFAKLLLDHGAEPNCPDSQGDTLLHLEAGTRGRLHMMRLLLGRHANVNVKNSAGNMALHKAFRERDEALAKIQLLINHGADTGCPNGDGDTPLHLAARAGPRPDLTKLLLESKVDVNARNTKGHTALHIAILELQQPKDVVQVLLAHHADPNIRNLRGDSPLHLPFFERRIFWSALDVENVLDAVRVAADSGQYDVAQILISCGADVNAVSSEGCTALHINATTGNVLVAELLCECGINVNARDRAGRTALHRATLKRDSSMVQLLFQKGIELDARDHVGRTALHFARQDPVRKRLLLSLGAQPLAQDDSESVASVDWARLQKDTRILGPEAIDLEETCNSACGNRRTAQSIKARLVACLALIVGKIHLN
jgi:ankyrin repeat protein